MKKMCIALLLVANLLHGSENKNPDQPSGPTGADYRKFLQGDLNNCSEPMKQLVKACEQRQRQKNYINIAIIGACAAFIYYRWPS